MSFDVIYTTNHLNPLSMVHLEVDIPNFWEVSQLAHKPVQEPAHAPHPTGEKIRAQAPI